MYGRGEGGGAANGAGGGEFGHQSTRVTSRGVFALTGLDALGFGRARWNRLPKKVREEVVYNHRNSHLHVYARVPHGAFALNQSSQQGVTQ